MKNKKAVHIVTTTLIVLVILAVFLVIMLVFVYNSDKGGLKPIGAKIKEAAGNLGNMIFPGSGTNPATGESGSMDGGTSGSAIEGATPYTNMPYNEKRQILSNVDGGFWVKFTKDGSRLKVESYKTSNQEIATFCSQNIREAWYFNEGEFKCCEAPTTGDSNLGLVDPGTTADYHNFCIKIEKITDGGVDFSAMPKYTSPGTYLVIGKTYNLKKGADYKFNSQLGTHTIKYREDGGTGVVIFVSKAGSSDGMNCVGWFNELWKPKINDGSCCSPDNKICGKVIERNTDYGYIKYKVCETARC